MDKEELVEKLGEPIGRLLDVRHEGEDPTASRDWDVVTAMLEEDGELIYGEETDIEFPSFRLDALGEGRLNDEEMREELGLDEDDELNDEERADFVRTVLRDEVTSGEAGESDVHPLCRGIWLEDSEGRTALLGFATSGEGFSGSSVEWYGLYDDEEEFREAVRSRGFVVDADDVDELADDELLALWE
jgi:hypothetical protein